MGFNFVVRIHAVEPQFDTDFVTDYHIDGNASTLVKHNITLINKSSQVYASKYALEINSTGLFDVEVISADGTIIPHQINITELRTVINVNFDQKTVGKDQSYNFIITYTQPDVAQYQGKVLEVSIPKISLSIPARNKLTTLWVSQKFGDVSYIEPAPNFSSSGDGWRQYQYHIKQQDQEDGISAVFGNSQLMQFTLNYHLQNDTTNNGVTQITIPPDTQYQKVFYTNLDPKPQSLKIDQDGNWLATYLLEPKQKISVVAQGVVELYLKPQNQLPNFSKDTTLYLKEHPFWQVKDPQIQLLANQLKTPEAIYKYLIETFTYNSQKLSGGSQRLGAKQALSQPTNVTCQEFTDAFIAIARAANIPARELNGFAYTNNPEIKPLSLVQDVLHSWPEYYDKEKKVWIPIDLTWGDTTGGVDYFNKLDLNHFTFVIHGIDSSKPYPAGYYRDENSTEKDVLVEFTEKLPIIDSQISVEIKPHFLHSSGLPYYGEMIWQQMSGTALYNYSANFQSKEWQVKDNVVDIPVLLPFSSYSHKLMLKAPQVFYNGTGGFLVSAYNKNISIEVELTNEKRITFIVICLALVFSGIIFTFISRRVLVYGRKRSSALRRKSQKSSESS